MIDDVFRAADRKLAQIDASTRAHLGQISILAAERRTLVVQLVTLARAHKIAAPQAYVAQRLGISQQTVSKIINRK